MEQGSGGAIGGDSPSTSISSIDLIRRARGGDGEALQILFVRYVPPLRRWATGRLPRWARGAVDTDDMVQDALIATIRNLDHFEPKAGGALHAYLRQALRRRVVDEVRKSRRQPPAVELPTGPKDPAASPLDEAIGSQVVESYEIALQGLSEADREAVVSRVELDLSYEEIALALGKPTAEAARMTVSRALVRLARAMGHEP